MVTLDQAGRGVGGLRLLPPLPGLADWIEHAWIHPPRAGRGRGRGAWRIVPDPAPHLIFTACLDRIPATRLALVGPRSVFTDADMHRRRLTVGLRLRPGALPRLVDVPVRELRDRGVRLEDLLGREGVLLRERLEEQPGPPRVARALQEWVARRADGVSPDWRAAAAVRALRPGGPGSVRGAARALGMAERTLRAGVQELVGLSPIRLARILRLFAALHLRLGARGRAWSRIAVRAGYSDQPHMIRDFRELLGETPTDFLARRA